MSVNKVILVGNVGKDAEVRYIDSGVAVASFSLATSENYTAKNGEKVTTTDWHNIVAWRGLAEFVGKHIKKGQQLYIEGQIKSHSYDDKEGIKRYVTDILANSIQMLGRKENSNAPSTNAKKPEGAAQSEAKEIDASDAADDLPF
jgi:single-strand DNA-binding protein